MTMDQLATLDTEENDEEKKESKLRTIGFLSFPFLW